MDFFGNLCPMPAPPFKIMLICWPITSENGNLSWLIWFYCI